MPSKNTAIAVRLPPEMYQQIVQRAAAEHRSLSNFVEHHLRRLLGPSNELFFKELAKDPRAGVQVDLEEQIARGISEEEERDGGPNPYLSPLPSRRKSKRPAKHK